MKRLLTRLLLVMSIAMLPAFAFQIYTENEARRVRQQLVKDEALSLVRMVSAEQQRIIEGDRTGAGHHHRRAGGAG